MVSGTTGLMNSTEKYLSTDNKYGSFLHFRLKQFDSAWPLKAIKLLCRYQHGHGGRPAGNRHPIVNKNRQREPGKAGICSCASLCSLCLGKFGCNNRFFFCVTWQQEVSDTQSFPSHLEENGQNTIYITTCRGTHLFFKCCNDLREVKTDAFLSWMVHCLYRKGITAILSKHQLLKKT